MSDYQSQIDFMEKQIEELGQAVKDLIKILGETLREKNSLEWRLLDIGVKLDRVIDENSSVVHR